MFELIIDIVSNESRAERFLSLLSFVLSHRTVSMCSCIYRVKKNKNKDLDWSEMPTKQTSEVKLEESHLQGRREMSRPITRFGVDVRCRAINNALIAFKAGSLFLSSTKLLDYGVAALSCPYETLLSRLWLIATLTAFLTFVVEFQHLRFVSQIDHQAQHHLRADL